MSRNSTIVSALILLALLGLAQCENPASCEAGKVYGFDENTKSTTCYPCPSNCQHCLLDTDKTTKCVTCLPEFYRTDSFTCSSCTPNCEHCLGPGLEKCQTPKEGYFYSKQSQVLSQCPPGCANCDSKSNCIRCLSGYHPVPKDARPSNPDGTQILMYRPLDCKKCSDPHCDHCRQDFIGTEWCTNCMKGFGKNPETRMCEACPEGCIDCQYNNKLCRYCFPEFELNPSSGTCESKKASNCRVLDVNTGKCMSCNIGYIFDQTNPNICLSCQTIDPFCQGCNVLRVSYQQEGKSAVKEVNFCYRCLRGFSLKDGKCIQCPTNCASCSNAGICYSCYQGYTLKNSQCVRFDTLDCDYVDSEGACMNCRQGTFRNLMGNKASCSPCHSTCLTCASGDPSDCNSCPIGKYSLRNETIGIGFRPYFSHSSFRCLENCPTDSKETGVSYNVDEYSFTCRAVVKTPVIDEFIPLTKYSFQRTRSGFFVTSADLLADSLKFVVAHNEYSSRNSQKQEPSRREPSEMQKVVFTYSEQCNRRGTLSLKLNFDREAYMECRCLPNYHGMTCEIEKELFDAEQTFVSRFVVDIKSLLTRIDQKDFYSIIRNLNYASLGEENLLHMTDLLFDFHNNTHHETLLPVEFLLAVDSVIRSHHLMHMEIERDLSNKMQEIDAAMLFNMLYSRLHYIISLTKEIFCYSLNHTDPITMTPTKSFQVVYIKPEPHTFTTTVIKKPLKIYPSDILNHATGETLIYFGLISSTLSSSYNKFSIVGWLYSNLLFSRTGYSGNIASYVFSLNIYSSELNRTLTDTWKGDYLWVKFPMRIVPTEEEFKRTVRCLRIDFLEDKQKHAITELPVVKYGQYEEDSDYYVHCKFDKPDLGDSFFTIGYNGGSAMTKSKKIERVALDEDDNFSLDGNSDGDWKIALPNESKSLLAAYTLVCILGLLF